MKLEALLTLAAFVGLLFPTYMLILASASLGISTPIAGLLTASLAVTYGGLILLGKRLWKQE